MSQAISERPRSAQVGADLDEGPVRTELRRQIARLEAELGRLWLDAFPRTGIDWRVGAAGGPRLLGTADLERVRDALVVRVGQARTELARRADAEEQNRALVERMIADPRDYRWVRISNEDVGERACVHWHSRPRWGVLGILLNWWRVKVSSGCPLASGAPSGTSRSKTTWQRSERSAARAGLASP